jgi:hypothetical protein
MLFVYDGTGWVREYWSNTTYSDMTAATSSAAGKAGLVPAPAAGKQTSFLRGDGTWVVPADNNTTYTFSTGDNNGTIKVTPSGGSAQNIPVKGLGSAAYTASTAYLSSSTKYAGSSSAGGAATSANKVNKALTFNNGGSGVASGTTFDGSTARTISYNTIGAAAASHAHDDKYYTKAQIDAMEFITIADIDNICVDSIVRYTVVNSIDEMTDTSKAYILASTGHIWIYKQGGNTTTETITEKIVATSDNPWSAGRLGSSGGISTQAGYTVTPYIDLSKYPIPFEIHLGGIQFTGQTYNTCSIFKADKTFIYRHDTNAGGFITNWRNTTFTANGDGTGKVTVSGQPIDHSNNAIGHVRFTGYGESANANIYVTYEKTTTTSSGWIDTGASQSSTSSASR